MPWATSAYVPSEKVLEMLACLHDFDLGLQASAGSSTIYEVTMWTHLALPSIRLKNVGWAMLDKMIKLIVLDADGTIWSHHDASALVAPFEIVSCDVIQDKYHSTVRLNDGIREFLNYVRENGILLSLASWNEPENVFSLLSLFGIDGFFVFPVVEPHPNKHVMLQKIVLGLSQRGVKVLPEEILYIDDRDVHLEEIRSSVGNVKFLRYGVDVENWYDALDKVKCVIVRRRSL
jgi:magnesium-dependent phosphatase-1